MWPFRFAMHRKRGLRMMVVSLISSSPKNGVEIMDGIESMTRGWWRPTPGSVYPLLTRMTEEGTVKKRDDGRYELTPKAKKEIDFSFGPRFGPRFGRPQTPEDLVSHVKSLVSQMEDLDRGGEKLSDRFMDDFKSLTKRLSRLAGDKEQTEADKSQ